MLVFFLWQIETVLLKMWWKFLKTNWSVSKANISMNEKLERFIKQYDNEMSIHNFIGYIEGSVFYKKGLKDRRKWREKWKEGKEL